jgi:hypothetical protein
VTALALLLALCAAAQSPTPFAPTEAAPEPVAPEPQAAPAPAASTEPTPSSTPSPGDGVHIAGDAPKPVLKRPMKAVIHKAAQDWEPVGLKEGGDPGQASTGATLRLVKTARGNRGERSKAKAVVRAYPGKPGESWLVIAVYPKALEAKRKHFEVRLRVVEGFVEKVEAALITLTDRRAYKELDKPSLRRLGVAFEEENPGSGMVFVAALDPRPGRAAFNAGKLSLAQFADSAVGFADVSWSSKSVEKP